MTVNDRVARLEDRVAQLEQRTAPRCRGYFRDSRGDAWACDRERYHDGLHGIPDAHKWETK